MLQRLKAPDTEEPRVVQLLDAFEHTSPNGLHQVLVMEPVHPFDSLSCHAFGPAITRDALRQIIDALAFIHSHGIAHGGTLLCHFMVPLLALHGSISPDLRPGNFGAAVPAVERFSVVDVCASGPKLQAILHSSPDNMESFPPYLCAKMDLWKVFVRGTQLIKPPLSMRILGLGNGTKALLLP